MPEGAFEHDGRMVPAHLLHGWSAAQVRAAEQPLLDAGVPLMARAARGLAAVVRELLADRGGSRLLVLAGSGSNGGDALLAAAELVEDGCTATVVALGGRIHEVGLRAALAAGAERLDGAEPAAVAAAAARSDAVLDGILGTGARGGLRSPAREAVRAMLPVLESATGPAVVAVDLPSGVDPDDGSVSPPVLPAATTVTFGAMKAGLLLPPGRDLAGAVRLIDIGLGPALARQRPLLRASR